MEQYTGKKIATFRERFAMLCDENTSNMTALAEALHVSKQTVSAWKSGTRSPKEPTIRFIANHFNVTIEWLMGFDVQRIPDTRERLKKAFANELNLQYFSENPAPKTEEARIISGGIDRMPADKREKALQLLELAFSEYFKEEDHDA